MFKLFTEATPEHGAQVVFRVKRKSTGAIETKSGVFTKGVDSHEPEKLQNDVELLDWDYLGSK